MNNLQQYFSYKKLKNFPYKIIFLNKLYFLQNEVIQCLKNQGHQVLEIKVISDAGKMLEMLLKSCVEFKPDFILGMNHIGFDEKGKIAQVLNSLNLPVIFWYLDDYRFIIKNNTNLIYPNTIIFSFESYNIQQLKNLGFEHVHFLPTATYIDPKHTYSNRNYSHLNDKITFIGNTFEQTQNQWNRKNYGHLISQLNTKHFFEGRYKSVIDFVKENQGQLFESENEILHYCGYVSAYLTKYYRINMIRNLTENFSDICVFGDEKWKDFNLNIHWAAPIHNLKTAPSIYAETEINLNISSTQLQSAVNLRVFDIPASGGFMITDWKENLDSLFDKKKEIITYSTVEELRDKIIYYRKHKSKRDKIIQNSKERIIKDHLLQFRISKMVSIIEETFK